MSLAKIMIYCSVGLYPEGSKKRARLEARKDIFDRLVELTDAPEERCSLIDNLMGVLKMDCDYMTLEDECIEQYENDIKELIEDIEQSMSDNIRTKDVLERLNAMLPEEE